MRDLLSRYLGIAPADVAYVQDPKGKPHLAGGLADALQFNLSHSGEIALLALATSPVGVDIEQHRALDYLSVARSAFTPREAARVAATRGSEQSRLFFSLWARKESYIKARGDGLSFPLNKLEICDLLGSARCFTEPLRRAPADDPWIVHDVAVQGPESYSAAVTAAAIDWQIRTYVFSSDTI
jgi:4'-phosphopantetheinyl transferase